MLHLTTASLTAFENLTAAPHDYRLEGACLDITDSRIAVFRAKLIGPTASPVWARAWLSTEPDGTLAEAASPRMNAGEEVTLTVKLTGNITPEAAFIRIESAPLQTKHIMSLRLS